MFINANGVPRLRPPTAFQIEAQGALARLATLGSSVDQQVNNSNRVPFASCVDAIGRL